MDYCSEQSNLTVSTVKEPAGIYDSLHLNTSSVFLLPESASVRKNIRKPLFMATSEGNVVTRVTFIDLVLQSSTYQERVTVDTDTYHFSVGLPSHKAFKVKGTVRSIIRFKPNPIL